MHESRLKRMVGLEDWRVTGLISIIVEVNQTPRPPSDTVCRSQILGSGESIGILLGTGLMESNLASHYAQAKDFKPRFGCCISAFFLQSNLASLRCAKSWGQCCCCIQLPGWRHWKHLGFKVGSIEARSLCKSYALPFFKSFLPLTQQILVNKCGMKLLEWYMIRKSWEAQNAKFITQAMPRRRSKRGDHLALDRLPTSIATTVDIPRQHSSFFGLF